MRRLFRLSLALAALACLTPAGRADVKMPALFSDNMVLQQGVGCPIWGTCDPGEEVVITLKNGTTTADIKPTVGQDGKWMAKLPETKAGGTYEITVKGKNTVTIKNAVFGEVWIASGQSNMEQSVNGAHEPDKVKAGANPQVRFFDVPNVPSDKPVSDVKASWVVATPQSIGRYSAVAYHFANHLNKTLNVPVGIIQSDWGGTICEAWASRESLEAELTLKQQILEMGKYQPQGPNRPCVLYNGMIAPLVPYAIKGALWYQGESNAGRAFQYRTLLPVMIKSWRDAWKQGDFPFLIVQLAPFMPIAKEPQESNWAELREAQLLTALKFPKCGMAVITDVGDEKDIHPKKKEPVGQRLSFAARALAYNEKIEHTGPLFDKLTVEGNKAILTFKNAGKGLEKKGEELTGFSVCGEDKKFYFAKAEIKGDNQVVVTCDKVEKPVAMRFGWANHPVVNLWNKDGLPASPFRTDDFPMLTGPKK
jgi:sialate O-acetylesterase